MRTRKWTRVVWLVVIVISAYVARDRLGEADGGSPTGGTAEAEQQLLDLFESRRSGEMVEIDGIVERVLPDDDDGSRHQRLVMRLSSGQTVLVAHNIDLAPRVPARQGSAIRVFGQYEWNEQGGVLHWTHDDPEGRRVGGWIEAGGQRYH